MLGLFEVLTFWNLHTLHFVKPCSDCINSRSPRSEGNAALGPRWFASTAKCLSYLVVSCRILFDRLLTCSKMFQQSNRKRNGIRSIVLRNVQAAPVLVVSLGWWPFLISRYYKCTPNKVTWARQNVARSPSGNLCKGHGSNEVFRLVHQSCHTNGISTSDVIHIEP